MLKKCHKFGGQFVWSDSGSGKKVEVKISRALGHHEVIF